MTAIIILLITVIVLALLWLLLIIPRIKGPNMEDFKKYHYAHRGYHDISLGIPENSPDAFKKAVDLGFGIELDVHLTKDGQLLVMHDESLLRTCGVQLNISEHNLSDLRKHMLIGSTSAAPTLKEVLDIVSGKTPLVIEIKPVHLNHGALTDAVCRQLESYNGLYSIESFDPRVLLWLKKNRPEIIRGQLLMNYKKDNTKINPLLGFLLQNLLTNFITKPDFIAYRVEDRNTLSLKLCRAIYGVLECSWTVKSPKDQKAVQKDNGVIIFEGFNPNII